MGWSSACSSPIPEAHSLPYPYAFGPNPDDPLEYDLSEPKAFLEILRQLDIRLVNVTIASRYYNPHYIRPALYPPSDGYHPPEDPFIGVMRRLTVVRDIRKRVIAGLKSLVLGGGMEIAVAADIRVAGRSARIGGPEIKREWVGAGASQMLPRLVGYG